MTCRVAEALDLLSLGERQRDPVVDHVDEGVFARGSGRHHVTDDHGNGRLVDLAAQLFHHVRRELDPDDRDPSRRERNRHTAGPDSELERRPSCRELRETFHRRIQDLGCEHVGSGRVVVLGDVSVPDILVPHVGNGPS